jgi:hypothetical protein
MRFALGVAVATAGVPALAATPQDTAVRQPATTAGAPAISKASYNRGKGMLVIVGTGFNESASVRLNGVELTGQRKFKAEKGKLRVTLPADSAQLKTDGQNRVEVMQGDLSSGEFDF